MADQSDDDFIDLDSLFGEASDEAMGVATPAPAPVPEVATPAPEESIEQVLDSAFTGSGLSLPDHEDTLDDFMSEVQQQSNVPRISKPWMKHHKFVRVTSADEVESIVDEAIANGKCSLDLETEGFDNRINYDAEGRPSTVHKIVGFCISVGDAKTGYYIPIRHRPEFGCDDLNVKPVERVEAAIRRLCIASQPTPKPEQADPLGYKEFETPPKVIIDFWNAKFDQEFLYPITGIDWWHPDSFQDGLLACYVLYSDDKHLGLKDKSKEKLRDPDGNPYEMIELKELFIRGRTIQFYALAPDEEGVLNYACSDAVCTRLLGDHPDILPKVLSKKEWAWTYRLEKMVAQVIRTMERCRVRVDRSRIERMLIANEALRSALREKIVELARGKGFFDFEPNSPKQLGEFLFGERGLNLEPKPAKNEKSQQYKTDAETLEKMVKEQADAPVILQWVVTLREYEKSQGTYLVNLFKNPDKNDELRFDFKQTGTQTGRFTAPGREVDHGFSGVPIHGMPHTTEFRQCFVARDGYTMIKSDYAGQELRIAANVSNEPVWVDEFLKGSGDLHTITARAFFGKHEVTKDERSKGKTANFALIYGGGPAAIIRATGCDKMEAHRRKASFDKAVPIFAKWVKGQHAKVKKDLGIWNPFGRWIAIPDANVKDGDITSRGMRVTAQDANGIRAACERHACNYPIQSAGADVMKIALVLLYREFYKRGWLRTCGDDSVRMLLTVHDEIVFEVRHDRVPEVLSVIIDRMAAPGKIPQNPPWKVPLIVEPLIGSSWGGEYDYGMLTHGKAEPPKPDEKLKPYEIRVGDRIYHRVPPWLEGIFRPGYILPPSDAGSAPAPAAPPDLPPAPAPASPPTDTGAAPAENPAEAVPDPELEPDESFGGPTTEATPKSAPTESAPSEKTGSIKEQIVSFRLREGNLSVQTAWTFRKVFAGFVDTEKGDVLIRVLDPWQTIALIDPANPKTRIRVRKDSLRKILEELCERNLTDGHFDFSDS